jgi:hypothetical protein
MARWNGSGDWPVRYSPVARRCLLFHQDGVGSNYALRFLATQIPQLPDPLPKTRRTTVSPLALTLRAAFGSADLGEAAPSEDRASIRRSRYHSVSLLKEPTW